MATQILLLTPAYIKDRSPLFKNVNDLNIRESIIDSQEIEIQRVLGSALFDEIFAEVAADTVSADNKILLDEYIAPALKFYTLLELANFVRNSYTPTGVKQRTQESAQEISYTEFKAYQSKWESRAEYYAKRLSLFIRSEYNEKGIYTAYYQSSGRIDKVLPSKSVYTSAIYLGDADCNCPAEFLENELKYRGNRLDR